jgi:hypothetical protein
MMRRVLLASLLVGVVAPGAPAAAREPGEPIRLVWTEGDVAGQTPIYGPGGGTPIGLVEYHQRRRGDELETTRVARFADGSSDEDTAVARVGPTLVALRGRSILRDRRGAPTVDLAIDVPGGRITGFYADDGERRQVDLRERLDPATYWGPLVFLVAKNFDANAEDGRVRFRTVAPTPRPWILTLELADVGARRLERMGRTLQVETYVLRPTLGWVVDPIVHRFVPSTEFLVEPGEPPSLARYAGPRNHHGQEIVLE